MVLIDPEFEKALISFMGVKELDPKTQKKYLEFYHKFANIYGEITTKSVDNFLKHNKSSPFRAMIRNLLTAIARWDVPLETKECVIGIDVPKVTGKKAKKNPLFITREEIDLLEKNIDVNGYNELVDGRTKIMILVQFWAGLRLEELLGLTIQSLDNDKYNPEDKFKTIIIRSETAKFKKERKAYIPKRIYLMLLTWIKTLIRYETSMGRSFSEDTPIWGIKANRYRALIDKFTLQILGKRYNTHAFRHGRGTDLIKVEKWKIEEVKEYLGHADISSTQLYLHLSDEDIKNKLEEK